MPARLLRGDVVPAGFEIAVELPDAEMGKVWNLWHNVTLSDCPEKWDGEIEALNHVQHGLTPLSPDHRLIRAQMAEFCRFHPSFPHSIEVLCQEIGAATFSQPITMGCEGRGLLRSLGYHDERSVAAEVQGWLQEMAVALRRWRRQEISKGMADRKVFGFLGSQTDEKKRFVEAALRVLETTTDSIQPIRQLCEDRCIRLQDGPCNCGRPFNCLDCFPANEPLPVCKCSYSMLALAAFLCAGQQNGDDAQGKEFETFVQENVLAYAICINAWLENGSPHFPSVIREGRYVSDSEAMQLLPRIRRLLGDRDAVKEWLVGCLLKTVAANQRWHKRKELMDHFPAATTYLARISSS